VLSGQEPQRTQIQFSRTNISSHPRHRVRSIQPPGGVLALGEYALFWYRWLTGSRPGASKANTWWWAITVGTMSPLKGARWWRRPAARSACPAATPHMG